MQDTEGVAPLLLGVFIGTLVRETPGVLRPFGVKISEDRQQAILYFEESANTYTVSIQYQGKCTGMPEWSQVNP